MKKHKNINDKIRRAEVVGEPDTGEVVSIMNFYKHINKDKFSIDLFSYGKGKFDAYVNSTGGRVIYYKSVLRIFSSTFKLIKYFKKNEYDIVHVHMTSYSFIPLFAAFLAGVKVRVCHAHKITNKYEGFIHYFQNLIKPLCKLFATHLIGCCKDSNIYMYGKKKGSKAFVINNAIDLNDFNLVNVEIDLKKQYKLTDEKIIGTAGFYTKQKNQAFLIESFSKMEDKNAHLFILGKGPLEKKLRQKARELGVQNRVHFAYSDNIIDFYSIFDLFVLPSKFEGLPLVLIEAQAVNIPCIVSNNVTKDANITGACQYFDIDSTEKFSKVLNDNLNAPKIENGAEIVRSKGYDISREAEKLEYFYLSIIHRKK